MMIRPIAILKPIYDSAISLTHVYEIY